VRFSKTKKEEEEEKKRRKRRRKRGTQTGGYLVWVRHAGRPGVRTRCYLFSSLVFFLCPLPLLHLCTLFLAALITCLALSFNLALLFDCANPCFECSLPRTPHSPTVSKLCLSRQSLLQSFTGSTCWLQLTPVCLVRTDKNLIIALL
jgi:hypothetical protein